MNSNADCEIGCEKKSRIVLERVICLFNFDIASSRRTMLLVASIMHHDYGSDFQVRGC